MSLNFNRMRLFITLFALFQFSSIIAQSTSDSIYVGKGNDGHFQFVYEVQKGENAFQLSKKYGINITDIQSANQDTDLSSLTKGQSLHIPLNLSRIGTKQKLNSIPVIYQALPKETLYTIAKRYFHQEVDIVNNINQLEDYKIAIGQKLIIGYLELEYVEASQKKAPLIPSISENDTSSKTEKTDIEVVEKKATTTEIMDLNSIIDLIDTDDPEKTENKEEIIDTMLDISIIQNEELEKTLEQGLAYKESVPMESDELFVLHPTAKVNSKMEISYPMLQTTAVATVISELPKELYPSNVSVVISPKVADALGAKDTQFRVEMKYIEE